MNIRFTKTLRGAKRTARHVSLFVLSLLLAFIACQDQITDSSTSQDDSALDFKTHTPTRSSGNQLFDEGDSIGIYSVKWLDDVTPGQLIANGNRQDNVLYWMADNNDNWESNDRIYYPFGGENIDLYAYYPYMQEPMNEDVTLKVSVEPDQSSPGSYKKSDFKAAVARELNNNSGPFTFEFYHRLSQVQFELIAGEDIILSDLLDAEITLKNIITDGSYSFTGGNPDYVTSGTETADIIPCGALQMQEDRVGGKMAIIVPQTLTGASILEIKIGSTVITSDFSNPLTFNSGESTMLSITLNGSSIDFTAEVRPWNEQPPIEAPDGDTFIFEWDVQANQALSFTINCPEGGIVDWGNGIVEELTNVQGYTYTEGGTYQVKVKGLIDNIKFQHSPITKVTQWGNIQMDNWNSVFYYCRNLTSIPGGIPSGNSFLNTFYECKSLTSLPGDLFENNIDVTSFTNTFSYCTGLISLPENLFKNNININNMNATFNNCTSLITIPENLFENNAMILKFGNTFQNCSSLVNIPEKLFYNCINAEEFYVVFASCVNLTNIPEKLFSKNSKATVIATIFYGCKNLTNIPEKLFSENLNVTNFTNIFYNCTNLTSIPEKLFDNNTKAEIFEKAFCNCIGLRGTTPKTDGIELWERPQYPQYPRQIKLKSCFFNCKGLDNYDEMPEDTKKNIYQ